MTANSSTQILHGNTNFTTDLYQYLSKKDGNVFFSPIGIHLCLSMVYQGAQEVTAEVLSKVLKLPDAESTAAGYKSIMDTLNSNETVTLSMANKIYARWSARDKVEFLKPFESVIRESFLADVEFIDFDEKKEAAEAINAWIKEKTKKIKNMIDESFIEDDTALLLINALYFKGLWCKKFLESSTDRETFYIDDNNTTEVDMMHNKDKYQYDIDEELGAKVLQLPYVGGNISMFIILPLEKNGIKDVEYKLASKNLSQIIQNLETCPVAVSLPKFKVEETIELKSILTEMGLENIFNEDEANFRKIMKLSPLKNLCVDKVLQKSFVEVNEEGTEAAVATVVRMRKPLCAVKTTYQNFKVDHPAIFMIVAHHQSEMCILFFGRLSCPK